MGCSSKKSSLTNSILPSNNSPTKEENQKEVFNEKSEQNWQDIKNSIISQNCNTEEENAQNLKSSQPSENKRLSIREQFRINANFRPIEEMENDSEYFQFLIINDYLLLKQSIEEPFKWKEENLEKKLTEEIKIIDKGTESMATLLNLKFSLICILKQCNFI